MPGRRSVWRMSLGRRVGFATPPPSPPGLRRRESSAPTSSRHADPPRLSVARNRSLRTSSRHAGRRTAFRRPRLERTRPTGVTRSMPQFGHAGVARRGLRGGVGVVLTSSNGIGEGVTRGGGGVCAGSAVGVANERRPASRIRHTTAFAPGPEAARKCPPRTSSRHADPPRLSVARNRSLRTSSRHAGRRTAFRRRRPERTRPTSVTRSMPQFDDAGHACGGLRAAPVIFEVVERHR